MYDLVCQAKEGAGNAVADGATGALQIMASSVNEAVGAALASLGTAWVQIATPNLTGAGAGAETVTFLRDSVGYYVAGLAVLAVIVGGIRLAWEQRGAPLLELVKAMGTLVLVSGASVTGIGLAVVAADGFSTWIIERSVSGTDFATNLSRLVAQNPQGNAILVIVLGIAALFATFAQIMLVVARAGMLVILTGLLPLTAAFTTTETGRTWFRRALGWTLAFVLYKPAAAIVYATAFRLVGGDAFGEDGLVSTLVGLVLMVLALFALPALLRFVTPLVSATAGGGGGGALGAAALASLPTGAMALAGRRGPSGSSTAGTTAGAGPASGGPAGSTGVAGPSGGAGPAGGAGSAGAAGTAGSTGAGGASAGGSAGGGAAAGGVAGAAVGAGVAVIQAGVGAVKSTAENASNQEGPRGSR
ncbi:hypothetical protein F1641_19405 [Quadrisphaera sp. INWT6]|nr:hypothetical protein [Quadrisphaera sp. INWT6]